MVWRHLNGAYRRGGGGYSDLQKRASKSVSNERQGRWVGRHKQRSSKSTTSSAQQTGGQKLKQHYQTIDGQPSVLKV